MLLWWKNSSWIHSIICWISTKNENCKVIYQLHSRMRTAWMSHAQKCNTTTLTKIGAWQSHHWDINNFLVIFCQPLVQMYCLSESCLWDITVHKKQLLSYQNSSLSAVSIWAASFPDKNGIWLHLVSVSPAALILRWGFLSCWIVFCICKVVI